MDNTIICIVNMFDANQTLQFPDGSIVKVPTDKLKESLPIYCYNNNVYNVKLLGNRTFISKLLDGVENKYGENKIKIEVN